MAETASSPSRSFVDEQFQAHDTASCHLSVQAGFDGVYAAVFHKKNNRHVAMKEFTFVDAFNHQAVAQLLEQTLVEDQLLSASFGSTSFGFIGNRSLLMPDSIFEEDKTEEYFRFNFLDQPGEEIQIDRLINLKARNIYAIPEDIKSVVTKRLKRAKIMHFSTPLIESLNLMMKNQEEPVIAVHVQYSHFELLLFGKDGFRLYNTFQYKTAEDLLYYLLFVMEQMELSTEKTALVLWGEIDEDSTVYQMIKKYVRHVQWGSAGSLSELAPLLQTLPDHRYFNLYQQAICE